MWLVGLAACLVAAAGLGLRARQAPATSAPKPASAGQSPLIWNDKALAEWPTPIAALGVRPSVLSASDYYAAPADNYLTYPVYHPEREPPGYWDWLQKQTPVKLVDPGRIRVEADWILQGERAFRDLDAPLTRTADPQLIARARDPKSFEGVMTLADGTVHDPRWVVTDKGLMLARRECSSCHSRVTADRRVEYAGPMVVSDQPVMLDFALQMALDSTETTFPGERLGVVLWRAFQTPWSPDPRVETLRTAGPQELGSVLPARHSVVARVHGSPFYGAKAPDLRITRFGRYLGATGTHRLRGPEDVARYAAFVTGADPMKFGDHRLLTDKQQRRHFRYADEVLYAIGKYVMALDPPPNPDPPSASLVARGQRIFTQQMCATCHAPPAYTSGRLTLAEGFSVPNDHPNRRDVMTTSVGTDPGLALRTRKGTGFYKIPSLRGVWGRPYLLHDASVASLEELFDAARLEPGYAPRGWSPPGVTYRPVPGHAFGLTLPSAEKAALVAFLRSL